MVEQRRPKGSRSDIDRDPDAAQLRRPAVKPPVITQMAPDHVPAAVNRDEARATLINAALPMQTHRDPGITRRARDDMVDVLDFPRRHPGITQLSIAHRREVCLIDHEVTNPGKPPADIRRGFAQ